MTSIVRVDGASAPGSPDLRLTRRLDVCANKLDPAGLGFSIAAEDAPSVDLRRELAARDNAIVAALRPIGAEGVLTEVVGLFNGLKHREASLEERRAEQRLYVQFLADLPGFALRAACDDHHRGLAGNGWVPSYTDLRKLAQAKVAPYAAERRRIASVLNARIRPPGSSPDRRAQIMAAASTAIQTIPLEGARAELLRSGTIGADEPAVPPETPAETLERLGSRPAPPVSDTLAAKLGTHRNEENEPWQAEG